MYITEGDLENMILQDIDASYSTWIAAVIAFVEAYVDKYCGTYYSTTTGAATKYYDGSGTEELQIDEFESITSVEVLNADGSVIATLTENSDFWTYPLNLTVKNTIKLSGVGAISEFPDQARAVKVVGSFGLSSVPAPIKLAAIQLAAKVINNGLRGGQVSSENLGSYSISYEKVDESADALGIKDILNMYREMRMA